MEKRLYFYWAKGHGIVLVPAEPVEIREFEWTEEWESPHNGDLRKSVEKIFAGPGESDPKPGSKPGLRYVRTFTGIPDGGFYKWKDVNDLPVVGTWIFSGRAYNKINRGLLVPLWEGEAPCRPGGYWSALDGGAKKHLNEASEENRKKARVLNGDASENEKKKEEKWKSKSTETSADSLRRSLSNIASNARDAAASSLALLRSFIQSRSDRAESGSRSARNAERSASTMDRKEYSRGEEK